MAVIDITVQLSPGAFQASANGYTANATTFVAAVETLVDMVVEGHDAIQLVPEIDLNDTGRDFRNLVLV